MDKISYDTVVSGIEKNYNLRAIESLTKGLFYLEDDNHQTIGILTVKKGKKSIAVLNKRQAYALIDEFKDICDMYF